MTQEAPDSPARKRRRRRRRRKGPGEGGEESVRAAEPGREQGGRDHGGRDNGGRDHGGRDNGGREPGRRRREAPKADGPAGPAVATPSSTRNLRKRRKRRRRGAPVSGITRRHRLTRLEMEDLAEYLERMPEPLLSNIYKGLGGQPVRVADVGRMVQLAVRAIAQGKRLGSMLRALHERERTALALLIQCGGLAHSDEFYRELILSLGGQEREWQRVMLTLAEKGVVCASDEKDGQFFYLVPEPLVEHLIEHLQAELSVSTFKHDDIRVRDPRPFCPPVDFSIISLTTYISQRPPRLTQQQEIFKVHQEEMDTFFAQVWDANSELFHFHVDFLMGHGLVELRGDRLAVNREVVEEFLNLDAQDQRDLIFRALDQRFSYAEWVMWAVHSGKGEWVPERPLQALYRRWTRGEDWRRRYHKGEFTSTRTHERESWSFAPLVNAGMLELGEWGQEKFYRLTPRALAVLEPPEHDGFTQFYLTPSFEIMAPAGLAPMLLFHIGEMAELTGCDRANTYKITEVTIEQALEKGWRRDDVLDFLRANSQIGLPENVEQTLRGWMGAGGDVEFHDCVLLTVHKNRIRKLESERSLKPFLLHRFVPGMYAVDRSRLPELILALQEVGLDASKDLQRYPGSVEQTGARERLHQLVVEARESSADPLTRAHAADTQPEDLQPVPGAGGKSKRKRQVQGQRVSPTEAREVIDQAIALGRQLQVVYVLKDGTRAKYKLEPERMALNPQGEQVVVAKNLATDERRTYKLLNIERVKAAKG